MLRGDRNRPSGPNQAAQSNKWAQFNSANPNAANARSRVMSRLVLFLGLAGLLVTLFCLVPGVLESSAQAESSLLPTLAQAKDAAPAPASTTPAPTPAAAADQALPSLVEMFQTSPIIISIILALSVVALLMFVYLLLTVNHNSMVPAPFVDDVMKMVLDKQYKEAADFCRVHRQIFVSSIIQRCVENAGKEQTVLMDILETEGRRRADILWNRISYLADIANVAPMLGLLGTVVGMMGAFFGLDKSQIDISSKFLSGQIGGAMATTMFGLIVAILALGFYSIVKSRATRVLAEAEQAVHAVADHIKREAVLPPRGDA